MPQTNMTTTHTLPKTHNGSVVTVTIDDSRYGDTTVVHVKVERAGRHPTVTGRLTLVSSETHV